MAVGWSAPNNQADPSLWQFGLDDRKMYPPGTSAPRSGIQYSFPQGWQPPTNGAGFGVLHSPAGQNAPRGAINYTPSLNTIHDKGALAPANLEQYSLVGSGADVGYGDDGDNFLDQFLADDDATPTAQPQPTATPTPQPQASGPHDLAEYEKPGGVADKLRQQGIDPYGRQPVTAQPTPSETAQLDPEAGSLLIGQNAPKTIGSAKDGFWVWDEAQSKYVPGSNYGLPGPKDATKPPVMRVINKHSVVVDGATGAPLYIDGQKATPEAVQALEAPSKSSQEWLHQTTLPNKTVIGQEQGSGKWKYRTPTGKVGDWDETKGQPADSGSTDQGGSGQPAEGSSDLDRYGAEVARLTGNPEAGRFAIAQALHESGGGKSFPMGPNGPYSATYNYAGWGGVSDGSPGHPAYSTPEEGAQGWVNWVSKNGYYKPLMDVIQAHGSAEDMANAFASTSAGMWSESHDAQGHNPRYAQSIMEQLGKVHMDSSGNWDAPSGAGGSSPQPSGDIPSSPAGKHGHWETNVDPVTGQRTVRWVTNPLHYGTDTKGSFAYDPETGEKTYISDAGPGQNVMSSGDSLIHIGGSSDNPTATPIYTSKPSLEHFGFSGREFSFNPKSGATSPITAQGPFAAGSQLFVPNEMMGQMGLPASYTGVAGQLNKELGIGADDSAEPDSYAPHEGVPGSAGFGAARPPIQHYMAPPMGERNNMGQWQQWMQSNPYAGYEVGTAYVPSELERYFWHLGKDPNGHWASEHMPDSMSEFPADQNALPAAMPVRPGMAVPSEDYRWSPLSGSPNVGALSNTGIGADMPDAPGDDQPVPPVPPQDVEGMGSKPGETGMLGMPHKGIDVQAQQGKPVVAPVNGTIHIERHKTGGLVVYVVDDNGKRFKMAHLNAANVQEGQKVTKGQPIGQVGQSGTATTGPNVHFEIQNPDGSQRNPAEALGGMAQMPMSPNTVGQGADSVGYGDLGPPPSYGGNNSPTPSAASMQGSGGSSGGGGGLGYSPSLSQYEQAQLQLEQQQLQAQINNALGYFPGGPTTTAEGMAGMFGGANNPFGGPTLQGAEAMGSFMGQPTTESQALYGWSGQTYRTPWGVMTGSDILTMPPAQQKAFIDWAAGISGQPAGPTGSPADLAKSTQGALASVMSHPEVIGPKQPTVQEQQMYQNQLMSALNNPWLTSLTGMAPGMGLGNNPGFGQQAYHGQQFGQQYANGPNPIVAQTTGAPVVGGGDDKDMIIEGQWTSGPSRSVGWGADAPTTNSMTTPAMPSAGGTPTSQTPSQTGGSTSNTSGGGSNLGFDVGSLSGQSISQPDLGMNMVDIPSGLNVNERPTQAVSWNQGQKIFTDGNGYMFVEQPTPDGAMWAPTGKKGPYPPNSFNYATAAGNAQPQQGPATLDWQTWQNMSPFQQAAWLTQNMAFGFNQPQVMQAEQAALAKGGQNAPPNVTQLTYGTLTPLQQQAYGNTAQVFGQSPQNWLAGQQRQWMQGQAAPANLIGWA